MAEERSKKTLTDAPKSAAHDDTAASTGKKGALACDILDWAETFATALCAVVLLFTFAFRVVTVDGQSMEDTLHDGERLIISDLFYKPQTGDVVITRVDMYGDRPLVKRVIATSGQTVDIDFDNWIVTVDGVPLGIDEAGNAAQESYGAGDRHDEHPAGFDLGLHRCAEQGQLRAAPDL